MALSALDTLPLELWVACVLARVDTPTLVRLRPTSSSLKVLAEYALQLRTLTFTGNYATVRGAGHVVVDTSTATKGLVAGALLQHTLAIRRSAVPGAWFAGHIFLCLSGRACARLVRAFPRAQSVGVKLYAATDTAVVSLAGNCPRLTYVDLCYNGQLTDAAFVTLASKCHALERVVLRGCAGVTDTAVAALANNCHALTYGDFAYCYNLTDAGVAVLATNCHALKRAYFRGCPHLTGATVTAIATNCHALELADLTYCPGISYPIYLNTVNPSNSLQHVSTESCNGGEIRITAWTDTWDADQDNEEYLQDFYASLASEYKDY
jgi:hypothetical protein